MLDSKYLLPVYISLGAYCKTAFQIRRFTGNDEAYFFDWLITINNHFNSLFINDDVFFMDDNWEIIPDAPFRLRDKGTGLIFQHEFNILDGDSKFIDPAKVKSHLSIAKNKFLHLKKKTIEKISSSSNVYLIRHENFSDLNAALSRLIEIEKLFLPINENIKLVLVSERINSDYGDGKFFVFKETLTDKWSGDNASWDHIFQSLSKGE